MRVGDEPGRASGPGAASAAGPSAGAVMLHVLGRLSEPSPHPATEPARLAATVAEALGGRVGCVVWRSDSPTGAPEAWHPDPVVERALAEGCRASAALPQLALASPHPVLLAGDEAVTALLGTASPRRELLPEALGSPTVVASGLRVGKRALGAVAVITGEQPPYERCLELVAAASTGLALALVNSGSGAAARAESPSASPTRTSVGAEQPEFPGIDLDTVASPEGRSGLRLDTARLLVELQRQVEARRAAETALAAAAARQEALASIAKALERSPSDSSSIAGRVSQALRDVLGAAVVVVLTDPNDGNRIEALAFRHWDAALESNVRERQAGELGQRPLGVLRRALEEGSVIANLLTPEQLREFVEPYPGVIGAGGAAHALAARIEGGNSPLGVIVLWRDSDRPPYRQDDARLLHLLGQRIGLLLQNTRLLEASRAEVRERRDAERRLAESLQTVADVIDALPVGLVILDGTGCLESVNRRWVEAVREDPTAPSLQVGQNYPGLLRTAALQHNASLDVLADGIEQVLDGAASTFTADVMRRQGGVERWFGCRVAARTEGGVVVVYDDVTDRRAAELEAAHRAAHDALTGLPNRTLLTDRLTHALARARRHAGTIAVLFIDLDRFKAANDTYGHPFGDALLVQVAARLTGVVRPGDTLARFGGDEFVLLCEDLSGPENAEQIADRVVSALRRPLEVLGRELVQTASVGLALASPGEQAMSLLARADAALLRAKEAGRGRVTTHGASRPNDGRRT